MRCTAYGNICRVNEYAEYVASPTRDQWFGRNCAADGHDNSAYSLARKRGNQLVRRTKLPWPELRRGRGVKYSNPLDHVYSQVVRARPCGFGSKPKGHLSA